MARTKSISKDELSAACISFANCEKNIAIAKEQHEKSIADFEKEKADAATVIKKWCDSNRAEFGSKKSLELTHGVRATYRKESPTFIVADWDKVEQTVLQSPAKYRQVLSLNKKKMHHLSEALLKSLKVEKKEAGETFKVEVKNA